MRRADKWQGDWVKEGATVHAMRATEAAHKDAKASMLQQQQYQQQHSQPTGFARR